MIELVTKKEGAEIVSLKFNGIERMHDGKEYWNRISPVLFPIVGRLKDDKTIIEDKTYKMGQHGFARDMVFEEIGEHSYVLKYNKETLKKYPYKFELYISYEIFDKEVRVKYRVKNVDDKMIEFGLGAHPAFKCEYSTGKYRLEFESTEDEIEVYQLDGGLVKTEKENVRKFVRENRVFLNENTFDNDAIIFDKLKSDRIYLKTETKTVLAINFKDFPYLGVWSKKGAPFICIEPWFSTADKVDSNGQFEEKDNLIELKPNQEFKAEFDIEFFD